MRAVDDGNTWTTVARVAIVSKEFQITIQNRCRVERAKFAHPTSTLPCIVPCVLLSCTTATSAQVNHSNKGKRWEKKQATHSNNRKTPDTPVSKYKICEEMLRECISEWAKKR